MQARWVARVAEGSVLVHSGFSLGSRRWIRTERQRRACMRALLERANEAGRSSRWEASHPPLYCAGRLTWEALRGSSARMLQGGAGGVAKEGGRWASRQGAPVHPAGDAHDAAEQQQRQLAPGALPHDMCMLSCPSHACSTQHTFSAGTSSPLTGRERGHGHPPPRHPPPRARTGRGPEQPRQPP